MNKRLAILSLSIALLMSAPSSLAQVTSTEAQAAFKLYSSKQYAAAAAAFEKIIRKQPNATYCYYAALANRAIRQETRAQQLFQYIASSFPTSAEAGYAKQALSPAAASAPNAVSGGSSISVSAVNNDDLPESIKASLTPEMQAAFKTPEGREALKKFIADHQDKLNTIRQAEDAGKIDTKKIAFAANPAAAMANQRSKATFENGQHPFSAADIAKDGASAIDQMIHPNCWFEASMASLAELPRGQRLIADMIRVRGKDTYIIRFPGDGIEYTITADDLQNEGIHDTGLWASLIEAAQCRKFPNNQGAQGQYDDQSRLEVGLQAITGAKAQVLTYLNNYSEQEISSFIGGAIKSQNPVVASTYADFGGKPIICFPRHAYTVIGFDPASNMITLRNPHGKNSRRFALADDPTHLRFQQLDDGLFKININEFQKYFYSVCRSFI